MKKEQIKKIIDEFKTKKIAVVGDLMLDVYIWGQVSRISPEAPVPIVQVQRSSQCLGGAANVMRNVVTLGGRVTAFGITGADRTGNNIRTLLLDYSISDKFICCDSCRNSTEKQRVIAGTQQLLRVDYDPVGELGQAFRNRIVKSLIDLMDAGEVDAVILEDYAKGLLNQEMVEEITREATSRQIIVALDPHPSHPLKVKGLTLMTPNRLEAFTFAGKFKSDPVRPIEKDQALLDVAAELTKVWDPKYLLITLGSDGMALFEKGKNFISIPTRAREVFDVSGAGDTVIAAFVLALLSGAEAIHAAEIANHAAGIVVGKIGTVAVTADELIQSFDKRA